MKIGDRIKELRLKIPNYSQIKLAKATGLTPAAISQYESNIRKPNLDALKKIAEVLNVSVDYLIGNDNLDENDGSEQEIFFRIKNLSEDSKKELDSYVKYLESKDKK